MERLARKRRIPGDGDSTSSESEEEADLDSLALPDTPPKKKTKTKKLYKQNYQKVWESMFTWIKEVDKTAYCKVCNYSIQGGITHLQRHESSSLHTTKFKASQVHPNIKKFFKAPESASLEKKTKIAEYRAVSFIVEHNLPMSLLDHLTPLLKSMFPDSTIAQNMACGRTKGSGIIMNVLRKVNFKNIIDDLKVNSFSLIVDETTDVSLAKSLAVVVRYCKGDCLVHDKFFTLLQVKSAKAEDITAEISKLIISNGIPIKNFIGFGADNASVMIGKIGGVATRLKELNANLFIMGCVCHSFNLCSSKASEKLPRSIEEFVRDVSNYFSNSSKRVESFEEFQEFTQTARHRLLRLCSTRWLSLQSVINRILEQWSALKLFFTAEVAEENSLHKARAILDALNNPIYEIYLNFLSYILKIINDMNLEFQSEGSRIFTLITRIKEMYKVVLKSFIKKDILKNIEVHKIDPSNPANFLALDDLYVGGKAKNLIHTKQPPKQDVNFFKLKVLDFYVALSKEIKSRFPFNSDILKFVSNFDPSKLSKVEFSSSISEAEIYFPTLVDDVEQLDSEWRLLEELDELKNIAPDETFWHNVSNLTSSLNSPLFPNLKKLVNGIMALPHSSATAERVFSQLSLIKTKTRNKLYVETCEALLSSKQLVKPSCYKYMPCDITLKMPWKATAVDHSSSASTSKTDTNNVPDVLLFNE